MLFLTSSSAMSVQHLRRTQSAPVYHTISGKRGAGKQLREAAACQNLQVFRRPFKIICEPAFLPCITGVCWWGCAPVLPNDSQDSLKIPPRNPCAWELSLCALSMANGSAARAESDQGHSASAHQELRQPPGSTETNTAWEHHSYSFCLLCVRCHPVLNSATVEGRYIL